MANSDPVGLRYEPGLDGLRGVAVAGVLLFHGGVSLAVGGFLGVSTFFTLSGFLITSLLLAQHTVRGHVDLRNFWARRARRLLPAAFLALVLAVFYAAVAGEAYQIARLRGDVVAALLYAENWRLISTGQSYLSLFSTPSPVQHFWSLAIEEQFYLVFPLIAAGLLAVGRGTRRGTRRGFTVGLVFLAAASLGLTLFLYHPGADPSRVYYGSDTRAFELIVGALLAVVLTGRGRVALARSAITRGGVATLGLVALGATLVAWSVTTDADTWLYRGGLAGYAVVSALLILGAVSAGPVRALLSVAPLRLLGRISYGVYLYHWPIFLWLDGQRTGLAGAPLFVLRAVVTIGVATVSFRFVEQPIRTGRRLNDWQPRAVAPIAVAGLCGVLFLVTVNPPAPAVVFSAIANQGASVPPTVPPGAPRSSTSRVLVVGDSVAQTLGRGLERWGPSHGVAVWNTARYYCGVLHGGEIHIGWVTGKGCDQWGEWRQAVATFNPQVVVVLATLWDVAARQFAPAEPFRNPGDPAYDAHFVSEYTAAIDLLGRQGARVVILAPPCDSDLAISRQFAYERAALLTRVERARPHTAILDEDSRICPHGTFTQRLGGVAARPDGLHFSDAGADWVSRWLMPKIVSVARPRGN